MPNAQSGAASRSRRRTAAAVLALAAGLLMAGCSFSCSFGEKTVSADELGKQVEASYVEQTGIELESISCDEVKAEVGEQIACEATNAAEVDLVIEGKITTVDDSGNKVDFDWKVASAEVPGAHYAEAAEKALEQQPGKPVSGIECPERVKLEAEGEFRCTLTAPDGSELGATVTMTDAEGGFDVKVDD